MAEIIMVQSWYLVVIQIFFGLTNKPLNFAGLVVAQVYVLSTQHKFLKNGIRIFLIPLIHIMKIIINLSLLFLTLSCRTIQYKKDYINKRGEQVFNDYNNNRTMVFSGEASKLNTILRNDKFLDSISFKKLKKSLNLYERFFALHPDSTFERQIDFSQKRTQIDSFYLNQNKIKYLKRNKIKSTNIHLLVK